MPFRRSDADPPAPERDWEGLEGGVPQEGGGAPFNCLLPFRTQSIAPHTLEGEGRGLTISHRPRSYHTALLPAPTHRHERLHGGGAGMGVVEETPRVPSL